MTAWRTRRPEAVWPAAHFGGMDSRLVAADLKATYRAACVTDSKQRRPKWADVCATFGPPPATRNRKQCPVADGAVRLIYLATREAPKRRTMPTTGRKQALNHFAILFEGRPPAHLGR